MFPMIGAFWNVRGLNKAGRLKCIADFIVDNKLDFVGFQETKKESFSEAFLKAVNPGFSWHWLPAEGTAGGILLGVRENVMELVSVQNFKFCATAVIRNVSDKFVWRLGVVYGSPYEEGKQEFIDELHTLFDNWDGPMLIGGDFNLVRNQDEKSNGVINQLWVDAFNDWINRWGLLELKNSSRSYTWFNNQDAPIMATLDRVLVNTVFDQKYPLSNVLVASRAGSDHVPLIINFGLNHMPKTSPFRFEKWWLDRPEFPELIRNIWSAPCSFENPLDTWQFKVRLVRKKIKGWAKNVDADIKKRKKLLMDKYDVLDSKYELGVISDAERDCMTSVLNELEGIWRIEETRARQHSRERGERGRP